MLPTKGASVEAVTNGGSTPLHFAARNGHTSTVELLLSKGASIASVNRGNKTPLDLATFNHHTDAINLLQNKVCQS